MTTCNCKIVNLMLSGSTTTETASTTPETTATTPETTPPAPEKPPGNSQFN